MRVRLGRSRVERSETRTKGLVVPSRVSEDEAPRSAIGRWTCTHFVALVLPPAILDSDAMAGPVKTEAVVLRSMRYGEADRILHVYTPHRGRVSAIAKGVRRARSRFGGRLEPFFRLRLELHEGRGELLTVTGAQTVDGHARLRGRRRGAGCGRARLRCRGPPVRDRRAPSGRVQPAVPQALAARRKSPRAPRALVRLAFRLKLLVAAGLAPQLGACAGCGEREHLIGFSGAAGGVVCGACEAASFPLGEQAYGFMTRGARTAPWTRSPPRPRRRSDRSSGRSRRRSSITRTLRLMPVS